MGALGDCELIRSGLLGQPVNALTALSFLALGAWLSMSTRWVGIAMMATGVGSLLFHGPMSSWSEWAHDVTLAWLITVVGGLHTRWEKWSRLPALAGFGAIFAMLPVVADPVSIALAVVVGGAILLRRPKAGELAPLALLAGVAIAGRLGATGGPWCDPSSPWQLHGLWHLGAAIAVTWWVVVRERSNSTTIISPVSPGR